MPYWYVPPEGVVVAAMGESGIYSSGWPFGAALFRGGERLVMDASLQGVCEFPTVLPVFLSKAHHIDVCSVFLLRSKWLP
jgi:hypothetical protein